MNTWLPFEWITAVRFLREGRMQTIFIVSGVAIGVGVIVFMSALLAGMQANFIKRVLTSEAHIQLIVPDEVARPQRLSGSGVVVSTTLQAPAQRIRSVDQWQKLAEMMRHWPGVNVVAPSMAISALAVRGQASRSVTLTGIDPEVYFKIVTIPAYTVSGQPRLDADDILIGTELANDLGVVVNDKLNVSSATGASRVLTIAGIFDLGNKGANERTAYSALRTAQALSGVIGGVTEIDVTVADVYAAERIAQAIHTTTQVRADSWIKTNAQFFTAISAQETANTLIRLFVGLSVGFGIASVLAVSVIQRSKDIGILRAMGSSQGRILRVFLLQGGLLGFSGALFGAALGGGAAAFWHDYMRQPDGSELFPLMLPQSLFVTTVLLAAATGVVAAAVPALRAARLDPVVAIRG
jgi:lipoprotein-releasing system permease protein